MDSLYLAIVCLFAGFLIGCAWALVYTMKGRYMGTITAVTGSAVYVDNWP